MSFEATKRLRARLDELGIEHYDHENGEPLRKIEKAGEDPATSWQIDGVSYCAVPDRHGTFDVWIDHVTPEQAIAATVGEHDTHAYEEGYADGFDRGQEAIIQQVDGIIHDSLSRIHDLETMIEDFWKERDS